MVSLRDPLLAKFLSCINSRLGEGVRWSTRRPNYQSLRLEFTFSCSILTGVWLTSHYLNSSDHSTLAKITEAVNPPAIVKLATVWNLLIICRQYGPVIKLVIGPAIPCQVGVEIGDGKEIATATRAGLAMPGWATLEDIIGKNIMIR